MLVSESVSRTGTESAGPVRSADDTGRWPPAGRPREPRAGGVPARPGTLRIGELRLSTATLAGAGPEPDGGARPAGRAAGEVYRAVLIHRWRREPGAAPGPASGAGAGKLLFMDGGHPYGVRPPWPDRGPYSSITAQLPRTLLPLPRRTAERAVGVTIDLGRGAGASLLHWLTDLTGRAEEFSEAEAPMLTTVTAELLASVLAHAVGAGDRTVCPEARRAALLTAIREHIRRNLADPGLSPTGVAAAHGVSLRHLHQLFAAEETTPAAWIRRCRLERCRLDLADPRFYPRAVQDIAARWGLTSPAHFSRAFRAAYGESPSDYRHRVFHLLARGPAATL
jgi:AraC-like DNA-binding protein